MSNHSLFMVKTFLHTFDRIFLEVNKMNLAKVGKFITELRKEQSLTQEQLGEKIGVTNKTISRWETGTYLPPADALLALSELYGVSINEILAGKRISEQEYKQVAEENLVQVMKASSFTLKDRIAFYKKKWLFLKCNFNLAKKKIYQ